MTHKSITSWLLFWGVLPMAALNATASGNDEPQALQIFSENFDAPEDFEKWTIVNVEDGSTTWTYRTSTGKPMKSKCAQILKHTPNKAEDWLISPGFELSPGNLYELSFRMTPGTFNKAESMHVYLGAGNVPESMDTRLLVLEDVLRDDNAEITYSVRFTPEESCVYHIGFLACSEPDRGRIDLDDVTVSLVSSQKSPGMATILAATPDKNGGCSVELSLKAPAADAAGEWIESLEEMTVYRDAEKIGSIQSPLPGSVHTWTDMEAHAGWNTYSVTASNSGGEGEPVACKVFVGPDVSAGVGNARAVFTDGSIELSWTAPSATDNGGWLDVSNLVYEITLEGADAPVASGLKDCSFVYAVDPDAVQRVYEFSITPSTPAGAGATVHFNRLVAGQPLGTPYRESFASGVLSSPWYADSATDAFGWIVADPSAEEFTDPEVKGFIVYPYDDDGGDLVADCFYSDETEFSRFVSPLFCLDDARNPVVRFAVLKGDDPHLSMQIRWDGGQWEDMSLAEWSDVVGPQLWQECMIPVGERKGHIAQFSFLCAGGSRKIHIDNVRVEEAGWSRDIAVKNADVSPRRAAIGETSRFTATLRNLGNVEEAAYRLSLIIDGEVVATEDGPAIPVAETRTHTFEHMAMYGDQYRPKSSWTIRVEGNKADECSGNDESDPGVWSVRGNDVPVPQGLSASDAAEGIVLAWDEAADVDEGIRYNPVTVIEDFESYTPFLKDKAGEWTIIDKDGAPTWAPPYPEFDHKGEPMAFQVFNTALGGVQTADHVDNIFFAHSGKQYMLCVSNSDMDTPNDDWLISPRLDGRAQTITFRCCTPQIFGSPDIFRTGYSTSDTDPDSFVMTGEFATTDSWSREYACDVPDGARYFAINVTRCAMFLKVDDVRYARHDGQPDALNVVGYNVYRDGVLLNTTPLDDATYTDVDVEEGRTYDYRVTTVYEQGESDYSAKASVTRGMSGIEGVVPSDAVAFRVTSGGVEILADIVLSVHSVDGRLVASRRFSCGEFLALSPGVYVLSSESGNRKVVIM